MAVVDGIFCCMLWLQAGILGRVASFLLAILFVVSCAQLALAANITKLPKETLDW